MANVLRSYKKHVHVAPHICSSFLCHAADLLNIAFIANINFFRCRTKINKTNRTIQFFGGPTDGQPISHRAHARNKTINAFNVWVCLLPKRHVLLLLLVADWGSHHHHGSNKNNWDAVVLGGVGPQSYQNLFGCVAVRICTNVNKDRKLIFVTRQQQQSKIEKLTFALNKLNFKITFVSAYILVCAAALGVCV